MSELKKCPFCNSEDSGVYDEVTGRATKHYVECHLCGASTNLLPTEEDAIAAWNKRADGWIGVEYPPTEQKEYLVTDGEFVVRQTFFNNNAHKGFIDGVICKEDITYWQPLPDPKVSREEGDKMKAYKCDLCFKYCDDVLTIHSIVRPYSHSVYDELNGQSVDCCEDCFDKIMAFIEPMIKKRKRRTK
jgi:Lar family restriction alleviation protein